MNRKFLSSRAKILFRYALLTMFAVYCFSAAAFAQRTTGDIQGTVTDVNGSIVPGVTITVTGVSVGFNRTGTSDSQGGFRFEQIPVGTYRITTAATGGFSATTTDNVTVTIENITVTNIKLGVASASESVVVTTDALGVNIETSDSKTQTNITEKLIQSLPKGPDLDSILRISPATRSEPMSGGFQVDGASGSENSFIVDGLPVENFRTGVLNQINNIPTSLISEVQVKTGGFEAEHGGASGAVIVVATKSGSDSFHGTFGSQFAPNTLQPAPRAAVSHFVSSSASQQAILQNPDYTYLLPQKKDDFQNYYPEATFSGPIWKGHIWFLESYAPQITNTTRDVTFISSISNANFSTGQFVASPRLGANGQPLPDLTYKASSSYQYSFSRIDAQILNNLRASVTYLWNPLINNGTLPFNSITTSNPVNIQYAGTNYASNEYYALTGGRNSSNNITSQLTWTPLAKLIATFRFGRAFQNEKGNNYGIVNAPQYVCSGDQTAYSTIATGCPGGINYQNITNNSLTVRDASTSDLYNFDVTFIPPNFAGKHEFKVGYEHGATTNDVLSGNSQTGTVTLWYGQDNKTANGGHGLPVDIDSDCANCIGVGELYRFGTQGVGHSTYDGVYIQDKWQPTSRLTLNLGVRLEHESLPAFNEGAVVADAAIPGIEIGWGKKIAPRLGGAYDLFGDGKTKIFASYGWFYDRMRFDLPRGSFGGDFYRTDYFPITADHPNFDYYTPSRILGAWTDPIGGGNPSAVGGLSQAELDLRIPANLSAAQFKQLGLFLQGVGTDPNQIITTGVDPNLNAYRQSEITFGFDRELSRSFVLSVRFTRKNIDNAIEDHAILGLVESENYAIGNPGSGLDAQLDKQIGYIKDAKPQRIYKAMEITLNKRFGNNFFFNANYTLSSLWGNYSGLASSDELNASGGGRTDPSGERFFDYVINGFTATGQPDNGYLASDRRHAFKAYGGYTLDKWQGKNHSTDFSFFFTGLSGTPLTTFITVANTQIPLSQRGDLGRTPPLTQTDFSIRHNYKIKEHYTLSFEFNVLNVFNQHAITSVNDVSDKYRTTNTIGGSDIDPNYNLNTQTLTGVFNQILSGQIGNVLTELNNGTLPSLNGRSNPINAIYDVASGYQAARSVRFGVRFTF